MALGTVANKQGRLAGKIILNPDDLRRFSGIDQTTVFKFFELAELDLSYAPPYAPVWDPSVWDPLLIAANQVIKAV